MEWEWGHLRFFSSANEIQCALDQAQSSSQPQEQPQPSSEDAIAAADATITSAPKPSKGTARRRPCLPASGHPAPPVSPRTRTRTPAALQAEPAYQDPTVHRRPRSGSPPPPPSYPDSPHPLAAQSRLTLSKRLQFAFAGSFTAYAKPTKSGQRGEEAAPSDSIKRVRDLAVNPVPSSLSTYLRTHGFATNTGNPYSHA